MTKMYQKDFDLSKKYEAFVYLWYDSANKKYYLGYHKGQIIDYYTHSSKRMMHFSSRKIPLGFRRRILCVGSWSYCFFQERKLLEARSLPNKKYYNLKAHNPSMAGRRHTLETRKRMSESGKKRGKCSVKTRKRMSESAKRTYREGRLPTFLGGTHTQAVRDALSKKMKGNKHGIKFTSERSAGENNVKAKLTEKQVRIIRCADRTPATRHRLSARFGVRYQSVRGIQNGKTWRHRVEVLPKNNMSS